MAYPAQTFPTLQELKNYTNTYFIPNGRKEIDGTEGNNILNGLADFIPKYAVNALDGADVISAGGYVALGRPVTVITNTVPSGITWGNNIQKEYYITNTLPSPIPLIDVVYYDLFMAAQTEIPINTTVHIAQAENGQWVQVNNLGGAASDIPNSSEDTPAISIILSGALNRKIEANINVSEDEGNALEVRSSGVFVPVSEDIPNEKIDTAAISINLSGTLDRVIEADLNISTDADNAIEIRDDGVYVPANSGGGSFTGNL